MAIVPLPNRPQVRRAPNNNTSISPAGAIRLNQAVEGAIRAGLGGFIQSKLEARDAKIKADEEAYKSQLNIISDRLRTNEKLAVQTFNEQTDLAKPEDVVPTWDALEARLVEDFESEIAGLRPQDQMAFREGFKNNLRLQEVATEHKRKKRLYEVEVTGATRKLENNLGDESPEGKQAVAEATEVYKRHFKADWKERIESLEDIAIYKRSMGMAQVAETPEQIAAAKEFLDANRDRMDAGREIANDNMLNSRQTAWDAQSAKMELDFLNAARKNQEIDLEALDEAVDTGRISKEARREILKVSKTSANQAIINEGHSRWYSANWRSRDEKKADKILKKMDADNPVKRAKQWKEFEKFANETTDNPKTRAFIKAYGLAEYLTLMNREDDAFIFYSEEQGSKIFELPESARDKAFVDYNVIMSRTRDFLIANESDIDISKAATEAEYLVYGNYHHDRTMTDEKFQAIQNRVLGIAATEVVKETLNTKPKTITPTQEEAEVLDRLSKGEITREQARAQLEALQ